MLTERLNIKIQSQYLTTGSEKLFRSKNQSHFLSKIREVEELVRSITRSITGDYDLGIRRVKERKKGLQNLEYLNKWIRSLKSKRLHQNEPIENFPSLEKDLKCSLPPGSC